MSAPDADPELDELESQSGLGKGLSSIISELADIGGDEADAPRGGRAALLGAHDEPAEAPAGGEADIGDVPESLPHQDRRGEPRPEVRGVRELRDDLIHALLDGLSGTMKPGLCAYLHHAPPDDDRFFCLQPSLDELGAQRIHDIVIALHHHVADPADDPAFDVAGFSGTTVATAGRNAMGLYVVARDEGLSASEVEVVDRFCRSFGRAVHQLDGGESTPTDATLMKVDVHAARDSTLAQVEVHTGDAIRTGSGRAATRVEAITRAVIVASGQSVTFRYASEAAHAGEHAAVVLLEGAAAAVSLGSARSLRGPGFATAEAALRALEGLS